MRHKKSLSFFVYFFGPCLAQKSHDVRRKPFGPQKFWRNTYDFFAKEAARDLVLPAAAHALVDVPRYRTTYLATVTGIILVYYIALATVTGISSSSYVALAIYVP